MMQTSVHLPREDTARDLGTPAYAKLMANLTFLQLPLQEHSRLRNSSTA
jgi:hypothetical protein